MKRNYIVFEIETSYSKEKYMCLFDPEQKSRYGVHAASKEEQADMYLAKHCFCDAYEITGIRDATEEEKSTFQKLLNLNKENEDFGEWEAGIETMYPNHDSVNEEEVSKNNIIGSQQDDKELFQQHDSVRRKRKCH